MGFLIRLLPGVCFPICSSLSKPDGTSEAKTSFSPRERGCLQISQTFEKPNFSCFRWTPFLRTRVGYLELRRTFVPFHGHTQFTRTPRFPPGSAKERCCKSIMKIRGRLVTSQPCFLTLSSAQEAPLPASQQASTEPTQSVSH